MICLIHHSQQLGAGGGGPEQAPGRTDRGPGRWAGVGTGSLCYPPFPPDPAKELSGPPRIPSRAGPGLCPSPGSTALQSRGVQKPELHPGSCLSLPAHKTLPTSAPSRKATIPVSPPGRCRGPKGGVMGASAQLCGLNPQASGYPWASGHPVRLPGPRSGGETPWRGTWGNSKLLIFGTVDSWAPPTSLPRGHKELNSSQLRNAVTWPLPGFPEQRRGCGHPQCPPPWGTPAESHPQLPLLGKSQEPCWTSFSLNPTSSQALPPPPQSERPPSLASTSNPPAVVGPFCHPPTC